MGYPPTSAPSRLSERESRLCVRVARLYYEGELTQSQIGELLGYSRVKINRVLRQAREAGIVQVRVLPPQDNYYELEDGLMRAYMLRDACVVAEAEPGPALYLSLARGAAGWLKEQLAPWIRIGLGLGRTVSHLPQVFHTERPVDCTVCEVVGAASVHSGGIASYNVTARMAELLGGKAEFFYAPTFVSDPELKRRLLAEPSVINALERARRADIILQSIGPVNETALLHVHGFLTQADLETLRRRGAVGDALGHYYDAEGRHVPSLSDDCVVGLDLEDFRRVPWSVVIAGGAEKVLPLHGALKGRYFNVLVTDRLTARSLLEAVEHAG